MMKRLLGRFLIVGGMLSMVLCAGEVKITEKLSSVDIRVDGNLVKIKRIQDTNHKLTNNYAKTSRPCPPFCVHPIVVAKDVETVGELELLAFLENSVKKDQGLLLDARMPQWYKKGTIPGAINIPFTLLNEENYLEKFLEIVGAQKIGDRWEFSDVLELMLFCNGSWCDQSPRAIKSLLKVGYPPSKIRYYRGGMQNWQMLGLTTIKPR